MKNRFILPSFICLLAVSCTVQETEPLVPPQPKDMVFYASLESSEPDTKVYLDENIKILWDEEDLISIFNKSTLNQKFMFDGETGENAGTFHWVRDDYFGAGNDMDYICSVYPYQESATISNSDVLTLTLPEEQTYREKSFGPGANTMVSITNDNLLKFKNVGGYLALKFYGGDSNNKISVSSITLAGNSGELLAGDATLTLPFGEGPIIEMAQTAKKSIILDCGEDGIELGTTSDDATIFWMVVPPTHFEHGFTLTVTDTNGDVFIKETDKDLAIDRNGVLRIKAIEVTMDSDGLALTKISSVNNKPFIYDNENEPQVVEGTRTVTVTMPTMTDFSDLLFNYSITGGDQVMVNGITLVNGETSIDASGDKNTIVVRNGQHGKCYKLIVRNTGLPVVRIKTNILTDGSDGFSVEHLDGYLNRLQNKDKYPRDTTKWVDQRVWLPLADKVFVTVRIEDYDGTPGMKNKNGVPVYETDTKIKGRGNYSWKWEKKPYALKFDSKAEVLGMPAHKRWVLLANWRDRTLLRNDATFWLAKKAKDELPYTTNGHFVELEINGEYRGNYYLCEQIKIDPNRVNITPLVDDDGIGFDDMSGGYLMEIDSYWDEVNKFKSRYFHLRYMFKEPDEDPRDSNTDPRYATAYSTMESYINALEKSLKTKSAVEAKEYENYLDVNSAIMFMLINELVGNGDFFQTSNDEVFGPHSTYLYKNKGDNNKLFMGPVWDFDYLTFTPSTSWRGFNSNQYYYYYLCHNQDFVDRIKSLWTKYNTDFAQLPDYIESMKTKLSKSQKCDEQRWPGYTQANRNDNKDYKLSYDAAIARMKTSFTNRRIWMDGEINSLVKTEPTTERQRVLQNGRYVWVDAEWQFP